MAIAEYGKKVEGYEVAPEDFASKRELTVTITLHEYRELVKIAERLKACQSKVWKLEGRIKELEELNDKLEEYNAKLHERAEKAEEQPSEDL